VARTTPVKKAWRALTWALIGTVALIGLNGASVVWDEGSWTPELALDLQGGTQITLEPQLENGQTVTQDQLNQAVAIMRDRIDASGVSEAEITTQGTGESTNVIVSIPGEPDEATRDRIQSSAKLEFRPVLRAEVATDTAVGGEGDGSTASPTPTPSESLESKPSVSPTDASDENWLTPALLDTYTNFSCTSEAAADTNLAPADEPLVACDDALQYKYILGPVEVAGERIADSTNSLVTNSQGVTTGQWGVNIIFDGEGTEQFADVTTRLYGYGAGTSVRNQFAVVLDGKVITAPSTNAVITDGKPQITGNFTQETSKALADQLKFGALPIAFQVQSEEVISATLGEAQLASGLIAGIIGLLLVFIYSLFQYRLLGLVTIASLIVAGVITYIVIALMSWRYGYRLSLAGVAGLIVAIGFTADSFIVYFERIRDELRDGRGLVSAVEAGWGRALRTIFAAKAVNLLSAAVLFILALGSVKGFALTLGITTIIDVIVVVLFTHPVLQLLASTRFFQSGHPITGLDPNALGAVYRGRAQFRAPQLATAKSGAVREAARRQTIAERKAAGVDPSTSTKNDGKDS
jgi:preprotein translocase subunit SecD